METLFLPRKVIKRDGSMADFEMSKIASAIYKAARSVGGTNWELSMKLAEKVVNFLTINISKESYPKVSDIQDATEKVLIENGHAKTAKAYILYRKHLDSARNLETLFDGDKLVEEYLEKLDWQVNENSNMTFSLQGLNNYIVSQVVSKYWLSKVYNDEIQNLHQEGDFHIHDLGLLSVYCCGWDLQDLLREGFRGVSGKVESQPPKHFKTALGQMVNFFYTLQGESAGAQAFSNFDTLLAPFVHYDNLSYEEVKQAMQEFVYNLNIPTRVGFQTPFTNLTFDLICPSILKDEAAIVGGEAQNKTYGEFATEMNMINKAFCEVMVNGDARGRVFSFPIPTYNITKEFEWDKEDYNHIFSMAAKYGIPYFSNFINSDMKPEDARSMCCRLRLDNRELRKRGGGLFGANPLTGSIGVVTINLPRVGAVAKTKAEFFERLEYLMDSAKQSLEVKRKVLENYTDKGLYPYSKFYLRNIKARTGSYWTNHFCTIGLVGMHEALENFLGKGIETKEGREFAVEAMNFMRDRIQKYQEATGMIFNLEATPAEGTSYRLAKLDKQKIKAIKTSGDKVPYYTNSTQLPVTFTDDLFEVLEHQDDLQTMYTGGTVLHGYLGEMNLDVDACKSLVRKIAENYRLPYFTITPTFSICPEHGYLAGEHESCNKVHADGKACGAETEVYSRIVGYIRPLSNWNIGKKKEFADRKKFIFEDIARMSASDRGCEVYN